MDFTNLFTTPIAAFVTSTVLIATFLTRRYREPRSLLVALFTAFSVNAVLLQPWYYSRWDSLIAEYVLFTALGFCFGAIVVIIPAKALLMIRRRYRATPID